MIHEILILSPDTLTRETNPKSRILEYEAGVHVVVVVVVLVVVKFWFWFLLLYRSLFLAYHCLAWHTYLMCLCLFFSFELSAAVACEYWVLCCSFLGFSVLVGPGRDYHGARFLLWFWGVLSRTAAYGTLARMFFFSGGSIEDNCRSNRRQKNNKQTEEEEKRRMYFLSSVVAVVFFRWS